jgi:hypothetical protein
VVLRLGQDRIVPESLSLHHSSIIPLYTNRSVWSRDSSVGILNRLQAGPGGTPFRWVPGPSTGAEATGV